MPLCSEEFPPSFKEKNGDLYKIRIGGSKPLTFHTLSDLEELLCDVKLKKIISVLGSREFLRKVLPEEVIQSISAYTTRSNIHKVEICFRMGLKNNKSAFFNIFGKGKLNMRITQCGNPGLKIDFMFSFDKRNNSIILNDYSVTYEPEYGALCVTAVFVKKKRPLSDFPWNAVKEAKKKIPIVYARLRDCFANRPRRYKSRKIPSSAKRGKTTFEEYEAISRKKYYGKIYRMRGILIAEDFLKGIFGKTFWNIFEYYNIGASRINIKFNKYDDGCKVNCTLKTDLLESDGKTDIFYFSDEHSSWVVHFINIEFVFFYDPEKDEISHVRLQNKLILNYETIQKHERNIDDTYLVIDDDDFFRPDTFWLKAEK